MSLARARALRSLHSSLRPSGARVSPKFSANVRTQLAIGRRYASDGAGGHAAPSSDMPWLISALVITPAACWYLWPSNTHADSGHGDAHHGHGDGEEAHGEEEAADGEPKEESEATQQDAETKDAEEGAESKSDDTASTADTTPEQEEAKESEETAKPSGTEGDSQPASSDANKVSDGTEGSQETEAPEGKSSVGKGKVRSDSDGATETRKREPDSKGGFKKRIDSGLGKDLGAGPDYAEDGETEAAATSKTPMKDKQGEISSKQFGLSTTATRHSTQIDQSPEKSKKGEGTPETAKSMGTVDVNRPQV